MTLRESEGNRRTTQALGLTRECIVSQCPCRSNDRVAVFYTNQMIVIQSGRVVLSQHVDVSVATQPCVVLNNFSLSKVTEYSHKSQPFR